MLSASLIVNFTWKIFNTKIFAKKFSQIIVKDDSEIIREFNTHIKKDQRIEKTILPIGDGITICKKL